MIPKSSQICQKIDPGTVLKATSHPNRILVWILIDLGPEKLKKCSQNRPNLVQDSIQERSWKRLRIQTYFWIEFGSILKRFWLRKWSQNQWKIHPKSMSAFNVVFWSIFHSKIRFTSRPRTSKINKNLLVIYFSTFNMFKLS